MEAKLSYHKDTPGHSYGELRFGKRLVAIGVTDDDGAMICDRFNAHTALVEALERIVTESDFSAPEGMKAIARAALAAVGDTE